MLLAVVLLSAAGYLSYRNISSIVSSINVDAKPELRLLIIREISMDLEKAQNSIRIYSVTKDSMDIEPYYNVISNIDEKMSRLRFECKNDSLLLNQADTISKLIEENIVIWNKLLYLLNDVRVVEYLKQLSDRLNTDSENARQSEKNILKRVFSRSNRNQLNEMELMVDLQQLELQERITKEELINRESQLAATGSEIKEQFYDLISKIENEIYDIIKFKASEANKLATQTYLWLALFSASGTLLAILVMFIVIRFVRKTHIYQVALKKSKDETEKLARTKELFIANMSHEIRTPVTAISGFTEQLLHGPLDDKIAHTLNIIKSSSDHLVQIINDILDFSKLQNDKLNLEKVHFYIGPILEDLYLLFEKHALRNSTVLSYSMSPETPGVLLGDPYRLKQIIINLVSNSIKFTKNGKVHISVKSNIKTSDELELVVEVVDTGIGIDENKIDLIFDDFTQEEMSTARKYGGTGLGLSIVKKLVELQNGSISCASKKNHGTSITCIIPYHTGDAKQIKKDIHPPLFIPEEVRNMRILIVDDEEYNRLLFKMILERWGVKFLIASSGTEALELLKTERFGILFMDLRMPGIDGFKTTNIIRREMNITDSEMPVICISALPLNDDWQKYQEAGMNAFLQKPFTEEMLLTTIISVINDYTPAIIPDKIMEVNTESTVTDKINLSSIYHISGGDEQFVKQMLISFIDSTERGFRELKGAFTNGDIQLLSDLAHKMLPPCRHIGSSDLYDSLKKVEESSQNHVTTETLEELIALAVTEFENVREIIKERISKIN